MMGSRQPCKPSVRLSQHSNPEWDEVCGQDRGDATDDDQSNRIKQQADRFHFWNPSLLIGRRRQNIAAPHKCQEYLVCQSQKIPTKPYAEAPWAIRSLRLIRDATTSTVGHGIANRRPISWTAVTIGSISIGRPFSRSTSMEIL